MATDKDGKFFCEVWTGYVVSEIIYYYVDRHTERHACCKASHPSRDEVTTGLCTNVSEFHMWYNRARQLYNNISMLFLFALKHGKLSTGVNATFNASCYG